MDASERSILKHLRRHSTLLGQPVPDEFVLPDYDGFGLVNVPATVLRHFGVQNVTVPPLHSAVVGDVLEGVRCIVVLLIDALGYLDLKAQMSADRSLVFHDLARKGRLSPITSVFPSTTAVALSCLHTARPPLSHGITGYRMYLPERDVLANMIRMHPEAEAGVNGLIERPGDAARLLGVPTVHRLLARAGVRSVCLIRDAIHGSGLSQMLYGYASSVVPFVSSSDLMVQIRKQLEVGGGQPAVIWAYWGALDTIQHNYGTRCLESTAEIRNLAFSLGTELIEPMRASGDGQAALLLTSDHGHVQVEASDVVSLSRMTGLCQRLGRPPTGTGRASYLALDGGLDNVTRRKLCRSFGDRALVARTEDLVDAGLWGPGPEKPGVRGRIGDAVVMMRHTHAAFYPYREGARPTHLVGGRHGGLHEREMLVPFIGCRL